MWALGLLVRAGAPAAQPRQLLASQVPAGGFGLGGLRLASGAGVEVAGVAAVVDVADAPVQLDDAGGDPVEQVAVVGDQQQAAPVTGQPLLQPGDGVEVEVVGGLVEDQQDAVVVGAAAGPDLDQRPGQRHPLGLPAGQGGHVGVGQPAHAQAFEHRLDLPPAAAHLGDGARRERGLLVEHDHPGAAPPPDGPGLGLGPAGQHPQQRRLAAPVQPDHGDAVTARDGERDVGEQRLARPAGRQRRRVEQDHPSTVGPTARSTRPPRHVREEGVGGQFRSRPRGGRGRRPRWCRGCGAGPGARWRSRTRRQPNQRRCRHRPPLRPAGRAGAGGGRRACVAAPVRDRRWDTGSAGPADPCGRRTRTGGAAPR